MANFPTLGTDSIPDVTTWEEGLAIDPTLKSPVEAGYVISRSRFTRTPGKWSFSYTAIPQEDKVLIQAFEKTVGVGSGSFNWTNPMNSTVYDVRIAEPIKYKPHDSPMLWDVSISLEEV